MENIGIVTQIVGETAKIRIDRESACGGNCVSCKGCPSSAVIIDIENTVGLCVGDRVKLTLDNKEFLKSALIGYGVMVVLMVVCAVLGYMLLHNESASVICGLSGLIIGFLILKIVYRNPKEKYNIEKIVD